MVSLQASVVQNKEITREFTPKIIYNKKKEKNRVKAYCWKFCGSIERRIE